MAQSTGAQNQRSKERRPLDNSGLLKSKSLTMLEHILLAVCLCALGLRTTYTEAPTAQTLTMPGNILDNIYSLSISGILVCSFLIWLVCAMRSKTFVYRTTGIELGLCIFGIAALISTFTAADKRLAISTVAILAAPIVGALLLVQLLDSPGKIRLVLIVIAALGLVNTFQSAEQLFITNQMTIEQYEQAPETVLEPLGVEPGTLQQFLFEHRLYAKTICGFFTTSNSLGSFLLMALAAVVALWPAKPSNIAVNKVALRRNVFSLLAALLMGGALLATRSKGAILSALLATCFLLVAISLAKQLKKRLKSLLVFLLLLFIAVVCLTAFYGIKHGKLPGGNSMLVRWQYWHASAKMSADHPLTGVGPGNFPHFYPHYKPDPAPESVADPHNFLLSILTQYGPLGLFGFLTMVFVPLYRTLVPKTSAPLAVSAGTTVRMSTASMLIVSVALLVIRPLLMQSPFGDSIELAVYTIVTLYIAPVAAFIIGFWVLAKPTGFPQKTWNAKAVLFCALVGVLLHNLIDFAIFEPGVFATFWMLLACLLAQDPIGERRRHLFYSPGSPTKALLFTGVLVVMVLYVAYGWWPACSSTMKIYLAQQAASSGRFDESHGLLNAAAEADQLSAAAPNLNGRLYMQHYEQTLERSLLEDAKACFAVAIKRNLADYKNYEKISAVYTTLGQSQEAYDWGLKAVQLYPGCDRLWFNLAKTAEELNRNELALQYYAKAVEIEDSYRRQFQIMYPRTKIVSRLGEDKYQFAKERIEQLRN